MRLSGVINRALGGICLLALACAAFARADAPTDGDATGTTARRIADCLQRFGVNTFSKVDNNGYPWSWGGSQGNYDAATTARAIRYLTGESGLTINVREYHRELKGLTPLQIAWMRRVHSETGSSFALAIGANGNIDDVPGMAAIVEDSVRSGLNYVKWVEGVNEPNMDFGSGTIPAATVATLQSALQRRIREIAPGVPVAAPAIVFSLPQSEKALAGYLGDAQGEIVARSDRGNVHLYSPQSPNHRSGDPFPGGVMDDVSEGFGKIFPGQPVLNTEWHPTLYSSMHKNDPAYDAYWGPIYLLSSCVDFDWEASFWFALFDYNRDSMKCGLFATGDADPYPVADAFRALFQLTGDTGEAKLTFPPGKLDVVVTGLPAAPSSSPRAGGRWVLFENSARQYFLLLWNEQETRSATTAPVTVTFPSHAMARVEEFNITAGNRTALRTLTDVQAMTVDLDTSLRLLRITY